MMHCHLKVIRHVNIKFDAIEFIECSERAPVSNSKLIARDVAIDTRIERRGT